VFKSSVRNKVAPEGCIAECYKATELVRFYLRYLKKAPTFHNRPQRYPDGPKGNTSQPQLYSVELDSLIY
jgi:hypothetical protein